MATWAPGIQREVAAGDIRDRAPLPAVAEGAERERSGERGDVVLVPVPLPVRDFSTLNGPKAFVREDASQPVVAVGFFFPSGRAAETSGSRGITELTLRAMLRGSKGFPGDALLFGIERFGGHVRIVNEPDFFGFVVEMLSRNAEIENMGAPGFGIRAGSCAGGALPRPRRHRQAPGTSRGSSV